MRDFAPEEHWFHSRLDSTPHCKAQGREDGHSRGCLGPVCC